MGSSFDAATVAAVIDDRDRVIGSLAQLAEAGIIESTGDLLDGVGYRFGHALLRDAAYETQVLETRLQAHAGVAHELERTGADPAWWLSISTWRTVPTAPFLFIWPRHREPRHGVPTQKRSNF